MIQRYFASPYIDLNGMGNVTTEPYSDGDLVYFADHEAEVSALRAQLAAAEDLLVSARRCVQDREREHLEACAELDEVTAKLADAHARIGRLRELAMAGVRPAGLVSSPESVRWFNARNKCDAHNDLKTEGGIP
jgi:hypothetical protein